MRSHGSEIARRRRERPPADVIECHPAPIEVHAVDAGVHGRDQALSARQPDDGSVVANRNLDVPPSLGTEHALDQGDGLEFTDSVYRTGSHG